MSVREAVSDSLRYWEPRRIVYNAVLALIVLTYFVLNWPHSGRAVSLGDVFVQVSGFRAAWQNWRWVLFAIGVAFAAIITRWFAMAFFA